MSLLRLYWLFHNLKLDIKLFFQFKRRKRKQTLIRDICSLEGSEKHRNYYECCKIPVLKLRLEHVEKRPPEMLNSPFCDDCIYFSCADPYCFRWKKELPEALIECEGNTKVSIIKRLYSRKLKRFV